MTANLPRDLKAEHELPLAAEVINDTNVANAVKQEVVEQKTAEAAEEIRDIDTAREAMQNPIGAAVPQTTVVEQHIETQNNIAEGK